MSIHFTSTSNHTSFASDNFASVHPTILEAIKEVNQGHAMAYGYDEITKSAQIKFSQIFGGQVETYFVFNGTGANVLALGACCQSFNSILCPSSAHINTDECGAPEHLLGVKIIPISSNNGKLDLEYLSKYLCNQDINNEHHSSPKVISISQSTELGTVYTANEIRSLAELAHKNQMYLHIDGARIANALVATSSSPKEMLVDTGVDVISFGGTKNGMMYGEAVVFTNPQMLLQLPPLKHLRKQNMQLASKMRYISAQFWAYFNDDLWLKNATHANEMAKLLVKELKDIKEIEILYPVEANTLFVKLPKQVISSLQQKNFFWMVDSNNGIARWMTSFDTRPEDVMEFTNLLKLEISR